LKRLAFYIFKTGLDPLLEDLGRNLNLTYPKPAV
jgi:hypothetical protein